MPTLARVADAADSRRAGQEAYLLGATLTLRRYQAPSGNWEHEHCAFCWATFLDENYSEASSASLREDPALLGEGYTNEHSDRASAGEHWICPACFEDFREDFAWTVTSADPDAWPYDTPEPHPRPTSADFDPKRPIVGPGTPDH
jgi:hypothetical protein